jgi:hypothetical protein
MKKNNLNIKWFTLIEVVIAMSLFVIFITTRFIIDNNSLNAYVDSVKTNNLELITNDLYWYLYSYKKTYWTHYFINLIAQWDNDWNCNWNDFNSNWNLNDEIDEYCFFYPYSSWSTIKFNNWVINTNNSLLNDVYLLDNNNWWYDWYWYRKIFNQTNYIITIWLKEDFLNSDKYSGFIWIFDPNMLIYKYKQNVVFE